MEERSHHRATLLREGTVLITGGYAPCWNGSYYEMHSRDEVVQYLPPTPRRRAVAH